MTRPAKAPGDILDDGDDPIAGSVLSSMWHVEGLLGKGGMATVHAATGLQGERVALKIMRPGLLVKPGALQRFLRESVISKKVTHPGMVRCFGEDTTDDGRPFLAFELLEGCTFEDLWRSSQRPSLQNLLTLFGKALDVLAACHQQGVVHRDLKPANLFLTSSSKVKVLDFGSALAEGLSEDFVRSGTAMGTPSFMAPEQAMGAWDHVDERADVFSIGATLFALLSGKRLHHGKTEAESFTLAATRPAPPLRSVAPSLPPEVISLVDRALQWDKRARFANAFVMKDALEQVVLGFDRDDSPVLPTATKPGSLSTPSDPNGPPTYEKAFRQLEEARSARDQALPFEDNIVDSTRCLEHVARDGTGGLSLAVLPWCLRVREETVWAPAEPFASVLRNMFADGIRSIETSPGWTEIGLQGLLRGLLEAAGSQEKEVDLVCALWPLETEGVFVGIASGMLGATAEVTETAWDRRRAVLRILEASGGVSLRPPTLLSTRPSTLLVDDGVQEFWNACPSPSPTDQDTEFVGRLVLALAEILPSFQAEPLMRCTAHELIRSRRPDLLLLTASNLIDVQGLNAVNALLLPDVLPLLLLAIDRTGKDEIGIRSIGDEPLVKILTTLGSHAVPACCQVLPRLESSPLSRILVEHVEAHLTEHVPQVTNILTSLSGEPGYRLVRALATQTPEAAASALNALALHDHSPLRIAAHAAIHGVDTLVPAVLDQLDAPGWRARLVALHVVVDHEVSEAVEKILHRIESVHFHNLVLEERQELLRSLYVFEPSLADAVAGSLVRRHGLLHNDTLNESRVLAAEVLRDRSSSRSAIEDLRTAETPMWWNPPHVRHVAWQARTAIEARLRAEHADDSKETHGSTFPSTQPTPVVGKKSEPHPGSRTDPRLPASKPLNEPDPCKHNPARFVVALSQLVQHIQLEKGGLPISSIADHRCHDAVESARKYALVSSSQLHLTFTAKIPFLQKRPLTATSWVFENIEPLVNALHAHGWSDLRIEETLRPEDVMALARLIASKPNDDQQPSIESITVGKDDSLDLAYVVHIDNDISTSALDLAYAAVVACLWETRGTLNRNGTPSLDWLLRAAQLVVELAATRRLAASIPTGHRIREDHAARWVDASVLAVEMCSFVMKDRIDLRNVALAGLLLSLAPFDERGVGDRNGPPSVTRRGRTASPIRLAARTLALIVGIPGVARIARSAACLAFDAQLRRYRFLDSMPSPAKEPFPATALATAIRFIELVSKPSEPCLDLVFETLRIESAGEREDPILRLLLASLESLPKGAIVELDTGEVGVIRSEALEAISPEPCVELIINSHGKKLDTTRKVDLAEESSDRKCLKAVLSLGESNPVPLAGSRRVAQPKREKIPKRKERASSSKRSTRRVSRPPPSKPPVLLGEDILEDFDLGEDS